MKTKVMKTKETGEEYRGDEDKEAGEQGEDQGETEEPPQEIYRGEETEAQDKRVMLVVKKDNLLSPLNKSKENRTPSNKRKKKHKDEEEIEEESGEERPYKKKQKHEAEIKQISPETEIDRQLENTRNAACEQLHHH